MFSNTSYGGGLFYLVFLIFLDRTIEHIPTDDTCVNINITDIQANSLIIKDGGCVIIYTGADCKGGFIPIYSSQQDLNLIRLDFSTISNPGTRTFSLPNPYSFKNCNLNKQDGKRRTSGVGNGESGGGNPLPPTC